MMESKRVETERARKADDTMAALMAVILGNQEEAAKGREPATRQAEILEAMMRESRACRGGNSCDSHRSIQGQKSGGFGG